MANNFGNVLRNKMIENAISVQVLAEESGASVSNINAILSGRNKNPRYDTKGKLNKAIERIAAGREFRELFPGDNSANYEVLPEDFIRLFEKMGMGVMDLSRESGVDDSVISRLKNGKPGRPLKIREKSAVRLARVFGVPVTEFASKKDMNGKGKEPVAVAEEDAPDCAEDVQTEKPNIITSNIITLEERLESARMNLIVDIVQMHAALKEDLQTCPSAESKERLTIAAGNLACEFERLCNMKFDL